MEPHPLASLFSLYKGHLDVRGGSFQLGLPFPPGIWVAEGSRPDLGADHTPPEIGNSPHKEGDEMSTGIPIQGSLFEEDYLLRSVGPLATRSDIALTELVANAWDAGASMVEIDIPDSAGTEISIRDDGVGMTPEEFRRRWMTLGYNRVRYQGTEVAFPPGRDNWHRLAYGRNGVGRHGMLCFASQYTVRTCRAGEGGEFSVVASSGKDPFELVRQELFDCVEPGTALTAVARRNVPDPDRIRRVLSTRFLHDPQFRVMVNGESVSLEALHGRVKTIHLEIEGVEFEVSVIEHKTPSRATRPGVAFWVGGRLVGEPSWIIGSTALVDRRTTVGRRHTIVVESAGLREEVLPDWTGFRPSELMQAVTQKLAEALEGLVTQLFSDRVQETQDHVVRRYRREIEDLRPLGRREVNDFVIEVTQKNPTIHPDVLSAAVQAAINLEKSRSGVALLQKISNLTEDDVEGLNQLLEDWTVRDAMAVLDEIDRRIAVIEALARLSVDPESDELHTLHPLVTQSRWLFGPEFDSPMYASNQTLRTAAEKVFGKKLDPAAFCNPKRRPDLLVLRDASVSLVGSERFENTTNLMTMDEVLLLELKRGRSTISREDVSQAEGYVQDFQLAGIDGPPFFKAFVVGHQKDARVEGVRKLGEPESARVQVVTYSQLVRTAHQRLFRLRDDLANRYEAIDTEDLLHRAARSDPQLGLDAEEDSFQPGDSQPDRPIH